MLKSEDRRQDLFDVRVKCLCVPSFATTLEILPRVPLARPLDLLARGRTRLAKNGLICRQRRSQSFSNFFHGFGLSSDIPFSGSLALCSPEVHYGRLRTLVRAALAAKEQDPDKLLELVQEINRLLEEKEARLRSKPYYK